MGVEGKRGIFASLPASAGALMESRSRGPIRGQSIGISTGRTMNGKFSPRSPAARDLLFLAVICFVLLFGGSSRADALSQPIVRLLSLVAIAASVAMVPGTIARPLRLPFAFIGAFAAVMLIQLIPVPASFWASFPPRDSFVPVLREVGLADVARPLSLNPDGTVNALLALLPALAVVITASRASARAHARAVGLVLIVAFASALLGIGQIYAGRPYFYSPTNEGSAVGLFANRNHFALLLASCFPLLALWLKLGSGSAQSLLARRWVALCAAVAIFPLLLATGSRAGLLLGLIGAALSLLLLRREIGTLMGSRKGILFAAVPLVAGVVALALMLVFSRAETIDRLFGEENAEARLTMLPYTLAMARDFMPWGSGGGSFIAAFKVYEPHAILTRFYLNNAHNEPVQMLIEYGAFGALLIVAFGVWFVRGGLAAWRDAGGLGAAFGRAGSILVLLSLGASLVDYPLRTPAASGLFALACCWMLLHWRISFHEAQPHGAKPHVRTPGDGGGARGKSLAERENTFVS